MGIPAMLQVDARIETHCAETGQPVSIAIRQGQLVAGEGRIHFPLPYLRWYDDLVLT